jgi:uncharacterized protein YbjQ (UPF0145 family)
MGKEPTALGTLIVLVIYSVVAAIILLFFYPLGSLIIVITWVVLFISILVYDSRHWGDPELENSGVQIFTKTRNLNLGEYQVKGMAMGTCVKARNMFSAARAEARSLVGGEARQFTDLVEECRNMAVNRMCAKAKRMGCNAVVGFRIITAETMWGSTEFIAYGTAVKTR